jgi:hypothetical protein
MMLPRVSSSRNGTRSSKNVDQARPRFSLPTVITTASSSTILLEPLCTDRLRVRADSVQAL